jgi:hypothetical protein
MSIYVRKRPVFDVAVTHPVRGRGMPIQSYNPATATPKPSERDWSAVRKAKPVNYMLPASMEWLKALPRDVRPMALAVQYPRIANLLAMDWNNAARCLAYFSELLEDRRGGRKGFPADVLRNLKTLRDYYYRLQLQLVD